jgi:hypothetical protein
VWSLTGWALVHGLGYPIASARARRDDTLNAGSTAAAQTERTPRTGVGDSPSLGRELLLRRADRDHHDQADEQHEHDADDAVDLLAEAVDEERERDR